MIASKHLGKVIALVTVVAVILCLLSVAFSETLEEQLGTGVTMEYEQALFDTASILQVNIIMDEEDWEDMLSNAISEEYYSCDVEINGVTFRQVGIRPKGNTSLSNIASDPDTDRYSFKLEFDHYVEGQTCYGLDKLVLNNNYADATNMKEAIVYDMFQYLGADASLYNYADLSVNGETWGVYLALEAVEDSFLLRNYGAGYGELYKPDNMNFGGAGGMKDFTQDELDEMGREFFGGGSADQMSDGEYSADEGFSGGRPDDGVDLDQVQPSDTSGDMTMPTDGEPPDGMSVPQGGQIPDGDGSMPGRNFSGGDGSDLNYTDDDLDSYSAIWEGEVNSTSDSDHQRVVAALKQISEGEGLEDVMDVDNLLKYMAVHTFAVNLDSLSGSMSHNYYLYEEEGQLNLIPWDYNLAWGGFQGAEDATETVNFPIDTPFSSEISLEDRQFFAALLENEEYLSQYHEYLRQLCEEYVNGGQFQETYSRIRSHIDSLVAEDPTAFYSYDEYDAAAETLLQVVTLRAESIQGQLVGEIPSTTEGQAADSSNLVDASGLDLSIMGTMNNGGGMDQFGGAGQAGERRGQGGRGGASLPSMGNGAQPDGGGEAQSEDEGSTPAETAIPASNSDEI